MKKCTFLGSNGNSPFIRCLLLKTVGIEFIDNWYISAQKSPGSMPKSCSTILSSSPTFFFQTAQPCVCRVMACGGATHRSHEGFTDRDGRCSPWGWSHETVKQGPAMEACWTMFYLRSHHWGTHTWAVSGKWSRQTLILPLAPLGCGLLLGAEVDLSQPVYIWYGYNLNSGSSRVRLNHTFKC